MTTSISGSVRFRNDKLYYFFLSKFDSHNLIEGESARRLRAGSTSVRALASASLYCRRSHAWLQSDGDVSAAVCMIEG